MTNLDTVQEKIDKALNAISTKKLRPYKQSKYAKYLVVVTPVEGGEPISKSVESLELDASLALPEGEYLDINFKSIPLSIRRLFKDAGSSLFRSYMRMLFCADDDLVKSIKTEEELYAKSRELAQHLFNKTANALMKRSLLKLKAYAILDSIPSDTGIKHSAVFSRTVIIENAVSCDVNLEFNSERLKDMMLANLENIRDPNKLYLEGVIATECNNTIQGLSATTNTQILEVAQSLVKDNPALTIVNNTTQPEVTTAIFSDEILQIASFIRKQFENL